MDANPSQSKKTTRWVVFCLAEKEGFEPSIPFWGIHDFQSCALGQLRDFSIFALLMDSFDIIQQSAPFVKGFFIIFQKLLPPISGREKA